MLPSTCDVSYVDALHRFHEGGRADVVEVAEAELPSAVLAHRVRFVRVCSMTEPTSSA